MALFEVTLLLSWTSLCIFRSFLYTVGNKLLVNFSFNLFIFVCFRAILTVPPLSTLKPILVVVMPAAEPRQVVEAASRMLPPCRCRSLVCTFLHVTRRLLKSWMTSCSSTECLRTNRYGGYNPTALNRWSRSICEVSSVWKMPIFNLFNQVPPTLVTFKMSISSCPVTVNFPLNNYQPSLNTQATGLAQIFVSFPSNE